MKLTSTEMIRTLLTLILCCFFGIISSFAATVTWTGGGDGVSWTDVNNWSTASVPNLSVDDVILPMMACPYTVTAAPTLALNGGTLTVGQGVTLNLTNNLIINDGTVTNSGTINVDAAGNVAGIILRAGTIITNTSCGIIETIAPANNSIVNSGIINNDGIFILGGGNNRINNLNIGTIQNTGFILGNNLNPSATSTNTGTILPYSTCTTSTTSVTATGCTIAQTVTTLTCQTASTITYCEGEKASNLNIYNSNLLIEGNGSVIWYTQDPNSGGTAITNPNAFDLSSLGSPATLFAEVIYADLGCQRVSEIVMVTFQSQPCKKWTGAAGDGLWGNSNNWSDGIAPSNSTLGEHILLNVAGTVTHDSRIVLTDGSLTIGPCTSFEIAGASTGAMLQVSGSSIVNNSGFLSVENTDATSISALFNGATIMNIGTIVAIHPLSGLHNNSTFFNDGVVVSAPSTTGSQTLIGNGVFSTTTAIANAPTAPPTATSTSIALEFCAGESVNLTSIDATVLNGQAAATHTVSYYPTLLDATCGTNAISSPYTPSGKVSIFARVVDLTTGCCAFAPISFQAFGAPAILPTTNICADETSNLTDYNSLALSGQLGTVTWYNGDPSTGGSIINNPTTFDANTLAAATDLWAQVTSNANPTCTYNINLPVTLRTNCVTWTACGDGESWEDGANWSTGRRPDSFREDDSTWILGTCVKINNANCPITIPNGFILTGVGYLNIGPGVVLTLTGAGVAGIRVLGEIYNEGSFNIAPGFDSGINIVNGGQVNNAACGSFESTGIIGTGIFMNTGGFLNNAGTLIATGANIGINTQNSLINTGTIINTPQFTSSTSSQITNGGSIYSANAPVINGAFCGNNILMEACPTITTASAGICIGETVTLAGTGGDIFSSLDPSIATINPTTGVMTGLSGGTACITYTNSTTGCQVNRSVTIHDPVFSTEPIVIENCGSTSCLNLNSYISSILENGQKGNFEWFRGNPDASGVPIDDITNIDINDLDNIWARTTLGGCLACTSSGRVRFEIQNTTCCTSCSSQTWVGGDTGDWNDPANWSGGTVPTPLTSVTIATDVTITGRAGCGINLLLVTGDACVQFELEDGLTVARNCTGEIGSGVIIRAGSSLCLQSGVNEFSGGNTCDEIVQVVSSQGILNIGSGASLTISPGSSPSAINTAGNLNKSGLTLTGITNNCGLLTIEGGFTGTGLNLSGANARFNNSGRIVIEGITTGRAIAIRGNALFYNECRGSIINNNTANSNILVSNGSVFFNYGYLFSATHPGSGVTVGGGIVNGGAINLGFFNYTNGTTTFATGGGFITDEGSFTTETDIKYLLIDPDVTFDCSRSPASCDCKGISETIPTMSQWGLMIFSLLLLNLFVLFLYHLEELKIRE